MDKLAQSGQQAATPVRKVSDLFVNHLRCIHGDYLHNATGVTDKMLSSDHVDMPVPAGKHRISSGPFHSTTIL